MTGRNGRVRPLLVENVDGVLLLTLNRPERRNAIDLGLATALEEAMIGLDADPQLSVAILCGGGGTFSSGMDLGAFLQGERPVTETGGFAGFVQRPPTKPLIAAVEGWALAGGFEMVLACDMVISGASARFGLPEVKRGLAPRGGGAFRLPQRLPRAIALEMLLTGEPTDAQTLFNHGLINAIVPDGQAIARALELAQAVARNAPMAVAATKQVALESSDWYSDESFRLQDEAFGPVFASEDAKEGARAFIEKRSPMWLGK